MKTNTVLTTAAVVLCSGAIVLRAQDMTASTTNNSWFDSSSSERYQPCEVTLEGFGVATSHAHDFDDDHGHFHHRRAELGLGAGAEFFFCRYVGIEAEGFSESTHHSFVDDTGGNLVLRLPIGNTGLAPYVMGGGGYQFDPASSSYGDGGAGLEYRFTRWVGIFGDGRFVATDRTHNYGLGRLGVRFNF
jgi:hypothetical protein